MPWRLEIELRHAHSQVWPSTPWPEGLGQGENCCSLVTYFFYWLFNCLSHSKSSRYYQSQAPDSGVEVQERRARFLSRCLPLPRAHGRLDAPAGTCGCLNDMYYLITLQHCTELRRKSVLGRGPELVSLPVGLECDLSFIILAHQRGVESQQPVFQSFAFEGNGREDTSGRYASGAGFIFFPLLEVTGLVWK